MHRILALVFLLGVAFTSPSAKAEEKDWTFLLFLNGNNNLDSFGALNINQMEKVGSSDRVNLVVQWASESVKNTRRIYVQKDDNASAVTSPVVQEMGNVDMGDARVLEDFIRWGVTTYPARHYFVAVWDHGSGWRALQARKRGEGFQISDISWDDNTGHSITTKQLGQVMNNVAQWMGRKIDIYGSDACLMGMVEVAGEMKNSVDFFLGSQELEPGEGWPYTEFFAPLVANPAMSPRDFSSHMVVEYTKSYSPGGSNGENDATMSAFDLNHYDAIKNAVNNLGSEISRMPDAVRSQVARASKDALNFAYSDYVDFGDFLKKLGGQAIKSFDPKTLQDATDALSRFVVDSKNTGSYQAATGMSIWIPSSTSIYNSYVGRYRELTFDNDTRWSQALSGFVGK